MEVLIAGGGIAGLSMALTCHEIGVPVRVFEEAKRVRPLGLGINLQPNAVRELYDIGLEAEFAVALDATTREWVLVGRNGRDLWTEPRGLDAGYRWPQFSVQRGDLEMMLHQALLDRLGPDAIVTGCAVTGYEHALDGVHVTLDHRDGHTEQRRGHGVDRRRRTALDGSRPDVPRRRRPALGRFRALARRR